VALACRSPRLSVTKHPALRCPDFPRTRPSRPRPPHPLPRKGQVVNVARIIPRCVRNPAWRGYKRATLYMQESNALIYETVILTRAKGQCFHLKAELANASASLFSGRGMCSIANALKSEANAIALSNIRLKPGFFTLYLPSICFANNWLSV
jgi:hypothetical protein